MSIILGLKNMNSLKYLIVNNNIHKDELTSSVTVQLHCCNYFIQKNNFKNVYKVVKKHKNQSDETKSRYWTNEVLK